MTTSGLSNDRRNFQCVTVAIVDLILPVLRDILNFYIKPVALYQKIKSCLNLKLSKEQQAICFIPPPGVPDYQTFDVTLLYTLIRNLCSLPCPAQGWGNSNWPKARETQISDDIERMRLFRNNYYAHANSANISDNIFKDIWGNLTSAISRIQSVYNVDYEDDLNRIEQSKYTLSNWEECMKILNAFTDKPDINIEGKNEIIYGHTAQFKADVNNVESSCWSVTWQKRNGDVIKCIDTNLERYSESTRSKLVIQSVCKEDEGEYQAVLSFEINGPEYRSKNAIRLHVIGEKPFLKISKAISGSEDITIHFNCGVSKHSPEVLDIEWTKSGQSLNHDVKKYVGGGIHDSRFSILSPKLEDRGNYSCKVTNAVGSVSANVMLGNVYEDFHF